MKVNYYEVLGVQRSASEDEIRNQFRRLARENHPDRYKGPDKADAERKFQTLTEAVNVLTNAQRRRQHDNELSSGTTGATVDFAQIARAYLSKGAKAWKDGDYKTAYENFDLAAKHNPQDAKAHHYLALAASRLRGFERQAVQAIEAAVQRDPMNALYLKDAGLLSRKAGLTAKAERYLEEALKWDASNFEVQTALAEIRQGRGETKEAGKGFSIFRKG
jgi:curved DNA-binding protein CbpA